MYKEVIAVENAVGKVLSHDVTEIAKGEFKGPRFKKGHIINAGDIEILRRMGKEKVYILELDSTEVHEDEAGLRLGRVAAGPGVEISGPRESRVNLLASRFGLIKIDIGLLNRLNSLPNVAMATLPQNTVVQPGEILAGAKVIPLVVKRELIEAAELLLGISPLVQVKPLLKKNIGVVVTGGEIYKNKVQDAFGPVLREKINELGSVLASLDFVTDEAEAIAHLIRKQIACGAEVVIVTGGMSVDPDDTTPQGIAQAGVDIISYGAPVLPGAMFLLGYLGDIPVLGVPACGIYFRTTILDLILPRILAGERVNHGDILALAHGGLCRACEVCQFPRCSFGRGGR